PSRAVVAGVSQSLAPAPSRLSEPPELSRDPPEPRPSGTPPHTGGRVYGTGEDQRSKRGRTPLQEGFKCTSEWASSFRAKARDEPIATSTGTSFASATSPSLSGSTRCGASSITSPTTRCVPTSCST